MSTAFGLAVYFIIWWLVLFAVLPFGVRTQHESGEIVPGTPESAPATPRLARIFLTTTVVSLIIFAGVAWILTHRDQACAAISLFVQLDVCGG